jgi:hypothetical protein
MEAMFRICRATAEGLFEEVDTDPFGSSDLLKRIGYPRLALHHFSKQSEPNRHNFSVLSQARRRLANEFTFLVG